jgi:hypothetical protein
LGVTTRRQEFSLTTHSTLPSDLPPTAQQKTNQTLRKAFRKTLSTASGFRVRMRTVFVPYVLLPSSGGVDEDDAPAAGMAESTVMLCVELENLGETAAGGGFAVEAVDVDVSGTGARAILVGAMPFPLCLGAYEQHNLLYAVSFVRSADTDDTAPADLQRAVAIYVHGRPYDAPGADADLDALRFPARQFASRWNCVLDLDPRRNRESRDFGSALNVVMSVGRRYCPSQHRRFHRRRAHRRRSLVPSAFSSSIACLHPPRWPEASAIRLRRSRLPLADFPLGMCPQQPAVGHP